MEGKLAHRWRRADGRLDGIGQLAEDDAILERLVEGLAFEDALAEHRFDPPLRLRLQRVGGGALLEAVLHCL